MLNLDAQKIKILLEVEDFNDLLNRYISVCGEDEMNESLWRLEDRDLQYRVDELALEIASKELSNLGIDSIAKYTGKDEGELVSAYWQIKYHVRFRHSLSQNAFTRSGHFNFPAVCELHKSWLLRYRVVSAKNGSMITLINTHDSEQACQRFYELKRGGIPCALYSYGEKLTDFYEPETES